MNRIELQKALELANSLDVSEFKALDEYLSDIVARNEQPDDRDHILEKVFHYSNKQQQLIENGYWKRKTNNPDVDCQKTKWYKLVVEARELINEQAALHEAIKPKKNFKSQKKLKN